MNTFKVHVLLLLSIFMNACFDDTFYAIMKEENESYPTHMADFPLSDTGQTETFGLPGTDGSYSNTPGALSFTDNGDGTITDNTTKLVWTKCSVTADGDVDADGSCSLTPGRYTWQEAVNVCRSLDLYGLQWQLPTYHELTTLVMFWTSGHADGPAADFRPAFDESLFPDMQYDIPESSWLGSVAWEAWWSSAAVVNNDYAKYWTRTVEYSSSGDGGAFTFNINFYNGFSNIQEINLENTNYVRCVTRQ